MKRTIIGCLTLALCMGVASSAAAQSCVGNCGSASANGVVTAPPAYGPNYSYISTDGGVLGAGQIAGVGGTDGSEYISSLFSANQGDALNFYFNYVTSDGATYADYAFAQLLGPSLEPIAYLFTARTQPSGDTSPGFGLPANAATLTPSTTPITGGTTWNQLGLSSGTCYDVGCGHTDWIQSNYILPSSGTYALRFGVTNWDDTVFESGLAFDGLTVGGIEIPSPGDDDAVPEPSTWAMMLLGFGLIGGAVRSAKKTKKLAVSYA